MTRIPFKESDYFPKGMMRKLMNIDHEECIESYRLWKGLIEKYKNHKQDPNEKDEYIKFEIYGDVDGESQA